MTVVNFDTGEIVEYDAAAAERRAERITLRLDAIADNYRAVLPMIREAIEKRDDIALGYRSPGDYVRDRFGQSLAGLGLEVRRAVVGELTEAGLSTRAIAPVVGKSHETVRGDIRSGVKDLTPAQTPEPATEGDEAALADEYDRARGYDRPRDERSKEARADVADAPVITPPAVTGIDGKRYPKPEPSAPRRTPLTDSFFRALHDARKKVESLHRLTEDDRWAQNAEKVALANRGDLLRINDLLQQVIASLPTQEDTQ